MPIETQNEIKDDGTYTFDHLIPGATYNTQVEVTGYPNATSDHVTVEARASRSASTTSACRPSTRR